VRARDLAALAGDTNGRHAPVWLGADFGAPASSRDPKRQVLLERLQRDHPEAERQGVRGRDPLGVMPEGTVAVELSGPGAGALGADLAALLHRMRGGRVRTRFAPTGPGTGGVARVLSGPESLTDPGDDPDGLPRLALTPLAADRAADVRLGAVLARLRDEASVDLSGLAAALDAFFARLPEEERDARRDAVLAGAAEPRGIGPVPSSNGSPEVPPIPPEVRAAERGEPWSDLPRFWDETGLLYHEGRPGDLSPDPFLALGAVPARAGGLRANPRPQREVPGLLADRCTGCGDCWKLCPHGAVVPVAASAKALLDLGMEEARAAGATPDPLRAIASKLVRGAEGALAADGAPSRFGDALRTAWEGIVEKSPPPGERRAAMEAAVDAVAGAVGDLPASRPSPFADNGGGQLLSLLVDADACTGCGTCVAACEPEALVPAPVDDERIAASRRARELGARLPVPEPAAIDRLAGLDVGPLAAHLLAPEARDTLLPGDDAEPGSGGRLALRQLLAAHAFHRNRRWHAADDTLAAAREKLADAIRHAMLDAVPTSDLDAISGGLQVLGGRDVEVAALVKRLEDATESDRVDVATLQRLVERAKELADLHERAARADRTGGRTTLVIGAESVARWVAPFPANPVAGPVLVDPSPEAAETVRGLAEEAAREAVAAARALRRAEHAMTGSGAPEPADLPADWAGLSDDERALAPAVVLVLDDAAWRGRRAGAVEAMLAEGLPVVVLVLTEAPAAGGPEDAVAAGLLAAGLDTGTCIQSTVAHGDALDVALGEAIAEGRPALVRMLAPEPSRAGLAPDGAVAAAREAVDSGSFVLFAVRPSGAELRASLTPASAEEAAAEAAALKSQLGQASERTQDDLAKRLERQLLALAGYPTGDGA
jgi:pyruvate-ferredoxin/flavodoxin oxidoreductase